MTCFGNGGNIPAQNHRLVSDCIRLPIRSVPKIGRTVTLRWAENLARAVLTRASPAVVVISTNGIEVEVELREWPMPSPRGRQRGIRWRFVCCRCGEIRDALHWLPGEGWGCRGKNCHNLAFASRHQMRYCTAIARRERLRRKLIRTPPRSLKAKALREQIKREERAMLAHLQKVNGDLAKRSERDARHGRADAERA